MNTETGVRKFTDRLLLGNFLSRRWRMLGDGEENVAEEGEKEDEHKRGWDFVNLSPREIGFRVEAK